jgi:DNA-3-methyladenine glycosylase I
MENRKQETENRKPVTTSARQPARCPWAGSDPLYRRYHDEEWGVPLHHDRQLFELLILEGAQAGLSWITILRKRAAYRRAFARFDPKKVAAFGAADVKRLLGDAGIVRNRLKIDATIGNARAFLAVQREHGSFDRFAWSFVADAPIQNRRRTLGDVPAQTPEAEAFSRALKQRGFRFVGPTIVYAFMQAAGLVNDHLVTCFRHRELREVSPRRHED